jgi:hypothetical protein
MQNVKCKFETYYLKNNEQKRWNYLTMFDFGSAVPKETLVSKLLAHFSIFLTLCSTFSAFSHLTAFLAMKPFQELF